MFGSLADDHEGDLFRIGKRPERLDQPDTFHDGLLPSLAGMWLGRVATRPDEGKCQPPTRIEGMIRLGKGPWAKDDATQ